MILDVFGNLIHTQRLTLFPKAQFGALVATSHSILATPRTAARQAPLSVGFSRQEYWNGLPCPPPRDSLDPGIEPRSPVLQVDSVPTELQGKHQASVYPTEKQRCVALP